MIFYLNAFQLPKLLNIQKCVMFQFVECVKKSNLHTFYNVFSLNVFFFFSILNHYMTFETPTPTKISIFEFNRIKKKKRNQIQNFNPQTTIAKTTLYLLHSLAFWVFWRKKDQKKVMKSRRYSKKTPNICRFNKKIFREKKTPELI